MKELSEHILDIAKNSVEAGARQVEITLDEDEQGWLTIVIADDGRGMSEALLRKVSDPFTTTRTIRKVGMGIPLYRQTAEQTGGSLEIQSVPGAGTTVTARVNVRHLDCPPAGDLPGSIALLIQGSPDIDFMYRHTVPGGAVTLDTRDLRQELGGEVALSEPAVFQWIREYLSEQEAQIGGAEAT